MPVVVLSDSIATGGSSDTCSCSLSIFDSWVLSGTGGGDSKLGLEESPASSLHRNRTEHEHDDNRKHKRLSGTHMSLSVSFFVLQNKTTTTVSATSTSAA